LFLPYFSLFVFLVALEFEPMVSTLASQALLPLEPFGQPFFVMGFFEIESHKLFSWGWL
jgi:hypothetical protein